MAHELEAHWKRNEKMWKIWEQHGINSETELRVNFQFYASKKEKMESLQTLISCINLRQGLRRYPAAQKKFNVQWLKFKGEE